MGALGNERSLLSQQQQSGDRRWPVSAHAVGAVSAHWPALPNVAGPSQASAILAVGPYQERAKR